MKDKKPKKDRAGRYVLEAMQAGPPPFNRTRGHRPFGNSPRSSESTRGNLAAEIGERALPKALKPGGLIKDGMSRILNR
jgi:hypothetical protein